MGVLDFFDKDLNLKDIAQSSYSMDYNQTMRTAEFENEVYNNALNYMYALNSYKLFNDYLKDTLKLIEANIK